MSSSFGRQHVAPVIPAFLRRYPSVSLDLRLSDEIVDFLVDDGCRDPPRRAEGFDARRAQARHEPPRAVLLARVSRRTRHAAPSSRPRTARVRDLGDQRDWSFATPQGPLTVRVGGRLVAATARRSAKALVGFGIAIKSTWDVGPLLASGARVTVLDDYPFAEDIAIWAVYPSRAHVPLKTLAFITFLAEHFGDPPYWDRADGP